MSEIVPVSRERHARRAWNKASNFGWMREQLIAQVSLQEAMQLVMNFPLAFVRSGESYDLVAMFGVQAGENVCVAPDGRWLAPRMPAVLQHYPFRLLRTQEGQELLGVDEAGLLPPDAIGGTPMFDGEGKPTLEVSAVMNALSRSAAEREQTLHAIARLQERELIEPWPIKVEEEGGAVDIDGLFRISEARLNQLPGEAIAELHSGHALALAYVQLLSTQHLQMLATLTASRLAARKPQPPPDNDSGLISFSNL